jgi:hypothetical protein
MIVLLALLLAQGMSPEGLRIKDEGVTKGYVDTVNCVGAGIACTRTGRTATVTVAGGGAGHTIADETVALTARATLNFTGTGVACTDNAGTASTDCTINAGAAAAGGSNTQVQYNNASALGGMARVTTDGNDLILTGQTSAPSAPATGTTTAAAYSLFGPQLPVWTHGDLGFLSGIQPGPLNAGASVWGCWTPTYNNTATSSTGSQVSLSLTGTAAAVNWASTDARTRSRWQQLAAAATINTTANAPVINVFWRGNAAGLGGFFVHGATAIMGTPPAGQRAFFGLSAATPGAAADPSATINQVGFQCDATQTTLRIGSNDNAGAATVTDLGANFPCTTTSTAYDWWIWAKPNASAISYAIRHMTTGNTASGSLSTDLPQNTVLLGWQQWINTGPTTAAAATIHVGPLCWIANP